MHCCWNFLSSIGRGPVTAESLAAALEHFFFHKVKHRFQKLVYGDLLRLRPLQAWRRYRGGMARAGALCRDLDRVCRTIEWQPCAEAKGASSHSRAA